MRLIGSVLVFACCGASAAKADWEYTKWGMTPGQVRSAAKSPVRESTDLHPDSDGNVTKLVAPYQSGKVTFEAEFGFDATDKLASVTLVLDDKSAGMDMSAHMGMGAAMKMDPDMKMDQDACDALLANVKRVHGKPQGGGSAHMQYTIATWQDQKSKNNVKYTVLDGVGCYVQYSAVKADPAAQRRWIAGVREAR